MTDLKNLDANSKDIVSSAASESGRATETVLRLRQLSEFVGQEAVRSQLSLVLEAAVARGKTPDHVLSSGPPGPGKMTLSMTIAAEVNGSLRLISGPVIWDPGDLVAVFPSLQENDVLFIDEIHRLACTAEGMLCLVMEDFRVDVMVGKRSGATSISPPLPPLTVVGATTRVDLPPAPLRDCFGFTDHPEYYEEEELAFIITRNVAKLQANLEADAAYEVASRPCGTPRIVNRPLRRVQDWVQVRGNDVLDLAAARAAPDVFEVDRCELDRLDRTAFEAACVRLRGGPVGPTTLAVPVGEEPEAVETVVKPYLVRESFLLRTPRGRAVICLVSDHLGLLDPAPEETLFG